MPSRPKKQARARAFSDLIKRLNTWQIPDDALDRVHDAAKTSLTEVKALTEYEDGKVSRLLTVVAFLSAVVGAVFARFASDYAWPGFRCAALTTTWILPVATYAAFFVYIVLVTWSVFRVLGAIKPTFNVPATWKGAGSPSLPTSMVFYQGILDVQAPQWGEAFVAMAQPDGKELKRYYAKGYIAETYLIAEKVADKLSLLAPGIAALRVAMAILLGFFVLFAVTIVAVEPTRTASVSSGQAIESKPSR
jgi:hypothetical protein